MQARSHYKGITGRYKAITSRYGVITESLRTIAQPLRVISHYGAGWLQRACALQRHSLRSQPSSEGLAPWVVPSAPLPQGDSLWLASSAICMRQAPKEEKRAGGPLHGDIIAQQFGFCNRGWRGPRTPASARRWGRMVLSWPAPLSHRPTLQRFWKQGDSPCTPGGGCAPCTLLGGTGGRTFSSPARKSGGS